MLVRLALAFGVTIGVFWLLITPWRNVEAQVISQQLFRALGVSASQPGVRQPDPRAPGPLVAVPRDDQPVVLRARRDARLRRDQPVRGARLDPAAPASRSWRRRAWCSACNFLRIGLSTYVGVRTSAQGLTVFHDWVGTAFGLLYVLAGFTLYLWVLLPSNRTLLKEYANVQLTPSSSWSRAAPQRSCSPCCGARSPDTTSCPA